MEDHNKNETPTDAPPAGQSEDVYSASTRVGQAPAEILELIAKAGADAPSTAPPPGPPKVLVKTPPAVPVTDFSVSEAKTAKAAVVAPAAPSSGTIDDDDWIIPEDEAKPPPPPTPVMPSAPKVPVAQSAIPTAPPFGPQPIVPPVAELAAPIPAAPGSVPDAPLSRPVTPRADFAPASQPNAPVAPVAPRIPTPRADFAPASVQPVSVAPVVGAVLGLVDAPAAIPEERASAAKLVAAAPDPNVRVSRVDEEIFSVRDPGAEGVDHAGPVASGAPPMRERLPTPQLGDPQVASSNPNHLPIAEPPSSMHVPIGEAKLPPSRTPVGAIVAGVVVVLLLALGAIVFVVLKK